MGFDKDQPQGPGSGPDHRHPHQPRRRASVRCHLRARRLTGIKEDVSQAILMGFPGKAHQHGLNFLLSAHPDKSRLPFMHTFGF